jgi:phosphoenolpyruvate synthase/pyruvate phosphate dikinase
MRSRFCLTDDDVLLLARWAVAIEQHYSERAGHDTPMDIEFASDGSDGGFSSLPVFELTSAGIVIAEGLAISKTRP